MLPLPTPHLSHLSSHTVSKDFQLHRNCLSNLTRVQQQLQPAQLSRNHASPEHAAAVTQPSPDSQRVAEQGTASTSGRNPELPTYADRTARAMVAMDTAVLNGAPKGNKWMKKADLYIVRTDGLSCTRETVEATGCLTFAYPSTQQHLLVWKTRPKCAMVLKKLGSELGNEFRKTVTLLQNQGLKVVVEPHEHEAWGDLAESGAITTFSEDELTMLHQSVDFVVCLGGDGVILHASYLFASAIPPVISFNLGSMGFLTNHSYKNFESDIMGVIEGVQDLGHCSMDQEMYGVHITLRMRLMCQIHRCDGQKGEEIEVLNEVVVDRGANPYLTKIECWEHDRLITKVQADGVMLATPTGSTAYSVAAGGSMVHPNVPAILFTPICPHSLSFRPVILPDYAQLDLRIPENSRGTAWVCFDGKRRQELQPGDYVNVRMSQNPVPTINKTDQTNDWFTSLERCFGWNERVEQGAATPPPKQ